MAAKRPDKCSDELALRTSAADGNEEAARLCRVLRALDACSAVRGHVLDERLCTYETTYVHANPAGHGLTRLGDPGASELQLGRWHAHAQEVVVV